MANLGNLGVVAFNPNPGYIKFRDQADFNFKSMLQAKDSELTVGQRIWDFFDGRQRMRLGLGNGLEIQFVS